MSLNPPTLLRQQLLAAMSEPEPDGVEVAGLAELLARFDPADPTLSGASDRVDGEAWSDLQALSLAARDAIESVDEGEATGVLWDRLAAMDELCAASAWLQRAAVVRPAVEDAVAVIAAFPEAWRPVAPLAATLLQHQPPRTGDPALALWLAVEAAALGLEDEGEDAPGAPGEVRIAAGLDVVIGLGWFRQAERRAAASVVPAPSPWTTLREGDDWSAGISVEDGQTQLIVDAPSADGGGCAIRVTRDGDPVELSRQGAVWRCPVQGGAWRLSGLGADLSFRLDDST